MQQNHLDFSPITLPNPFSASHPRGPRDSTRARHRRNVGRNRIPFLRGHRSCWRINNAWQPKAGFLSGIWPIVVLVHTIRHRDLHSAVRVRTPAIRCAGSTRSPAPLPDAMSARRLEYRPVGFVAGCICLDWMSVPEMEVGAATSLVLAVATPLPAWHFILLGTGASCTV
jgi:hypothetical protein